MHAIPATVIDTLDFSPLTMTPVRRQEALNLFNARVLEFYQLSGQMLPLESLKVLGQSIVSTYVATEVNKPPTVVNVKVAKLKKSKGLVHWQNDRTIVEAFIAFVDANFVVTDAPFTKFKAVMVAFNASQTQWRLAEQWSDAYVSLMADLKVSTERIINPAFTKHQGLGTRYVALKAKTEGLVKLNDTVEGIKPAPAAVTPTPMPLLSPGIQHTVVPQPIRPVGHQVTPVVQTPILAAGIGQMVAHPGASVNV